MSTLKTNSATSQGAVIALQDSRPEQALEGLNRITGLNFARWPESLVPQAQLAQAPSVDPLEDYLLDFDAELAHCGG